MHDLLFFAHNYLTVFEAATSDERSKLGQSFLTRADEIAQSTGCRDLVALVDSDDAFLWEGALQTSRAKFFGRDTVPAAERFYCAAYALTHLMLLNAAGALRNHPEEAAVARMGGQLYSAEYALRERRGQ